MTFFEFMSESGCGMPTWRRSAGIDEEGRVYAPAALAGNEQRVFLCASWDGVPMASHLKHVYLPTTWLAREHPDLREVCERIETLVHGAAAQGS